MDKSEVSNAEEIKNMIKVRNELGWGAINNFIKWLNPDGLHDSLVLQWRQEMQNLITSRKELGWGDIDEFIKKHNPEGCRPSLLR